jgi:hypothetical protein
VEPARQRQGDSPRRALEQQPERGQLGHVALNFTYIPKIEPKSVPLWFFQLKINLTNLL